MFLILAALTAVAGEPAAETPAKKIETAIWVAKPTGEDVARVYPEASQRKNVEGVATMTCTVSADGRLTGCAVTRQYPASAGFGEATLKLAPLFRMERATKDGAPVEGETIDVPVRYVLPGSEFMRRPDLDDVAACYGQFANRAEANAEDLQAWRGAMYWGAKMMSAAAGRYSSPSQVEAAMGRARAEAANRTLKPKRGYELASCVARLPK